MYKLQILTQWQQANNENSPVITLQNGDSWMDITGQQNILPNPNSVVLEVWANNPTPYENDGTITVLSSEEIINETP